MRNHAEAVRLIPASAGWDDESRGETLYTAEFKDGFHDDWESEQARRSAPRSGAWVFEGLVPSVP